jgi:hypothetical protein
MTTATHPAAIKPKARSLEEIEIQHAVARWADPSGKPRCKQDVIQCWAEDWPAILASDPRFSTWSVLTFGLTIIAISPKESIRKATRR